MVDVQFTIDENEFDSAVDVLESVKDGVENAARKAINDTLLKIRASATRKIKKRLAIKSKDIREEIKITRANKDPDRAGLKGKITVTGSRVPLFAFGARQTKKGVTYRIKTGAKRELLPGAFLIKQIPQVFVRRFVKGVPDKRVGRKPLRTITGPSVVKVFEQEVLEAVQAETTDLLAERFQFHVDDQLQKAGL